MCFESRLPRSAEDLSAWEGAQIFLGGGWAGGIKKRAPACSPAAAVRVRRCHSSLRCVKLRAVCEDQNIYTFPWPREFVLVDPSWKK